MYFHELPGFAHQFQNELTEKCNKPSNELPYLTEAMPNYPNQRFVVATKSTQNVENGGLMKFAFYILLKKNI